MQLEFLGNKEHGGWTTDVDGLSKDSVVYAFGVGDNISWDLAMIQRFGCTVHAFDPTESSAQWLQSQKIPEQFRFTQVGISSFDGQETFYLPLKEGKPDYSTVKKGGRSTTFPVKTLQALMMERGHSRIDVLKLDIEGSEFYVLPQIADLKIRQILVEIHTVFYSQGWKGMRRWVGWARTKWAIWHLTRHGFRCVQKLGDDYTFIKVQ